MFSELFSASNDVKELTIAGMYWHNVCNTMSMDKASLQQTSLTANILIIVAIKYTTTGHYLDAHGTLSCDPTYDYIFIVSFLFFLF